MGTLIKIDFKLGFKIERKINLYFRQVIEDLVASGEFSLESPFDSMRKYHINSNFLFINLDRVLTVDYKLPAKEGAMWTYTILSKIWVITTLKL